ncbi:MAG: hypothetical protein PHW82_09945 [Bacteroidales bacterium]|nr:hypothetical protein [Bacteroidales bacterium]
MKIYIAANNNISENLICKEKTDFLKKFSCLNDTNFVLSEPSVIWFLSGGSEHRAIEQIEAQNRYCFLASTKDNSWAAATEVKAFLNEKGIKTKIFNVDSITNLAPLQKFLDEKDIYDNTKLALIGKPENWLLASVPDYELLKEVLGIEIIEYDWSEILQLKDSNFDEFDKYFAKYNYKTFEKDRSLYNKMLSFTQGEDISAMAISCFEFVKKHDYTACLPVALLNTNNIPTVCEGDLCSAAGIIALSRLTGKTPWVANINAIDRETVIFSHCTIPLNLLDEFDVTSHFETQKGSAIKGKMSNQTLTIFRLDKNLEFCFLALGEIIESGDIIQACRTQIKVKMSHKSTFLLREFPLGNHHLIIPGDYTDILAEYFTNKGFRIV